MLYVYAADLETQEGVNRTRLATEYPVIPASWMEARHCMMERQAGTRTPEGWSTKMALEMRMKIIHFGNTVHWFMVEPSKTSVWKLLDTSRVVLKVNEAVRIASSKAKHILNSKSEFHQAPLIRQVVAHGLSGDQGEDLVVVRRGGGAGRGRVRGARGRGRRGRSARVKGKV